jgi:hypothetical protein
MSGPLVIPFNFCPLSIETKTSSYSIPAGHYALVKPMCGNFKIGSDYAGVTESITVGTVNNTTITTTRGITPGSWTTVEVVSSGFADTATLTLTFKVAEFAGETTLKSHTLTPNSTDVKINRLENCNRVVLDAVDSGGSSFLVSTYRISQLPYGQEYWVPAGTSLDGSQYVVELYAQIT